MNARVAELFENREFVEKIFPMSFEEVQAAIEAEGGIVTIDELKEIAAEASAILSGEKDAELNEDELDSVAGGLSWKQFIKTCAYALAGSAAGAKIGAVGGPWGSFAGAFAGAFIGCYIASR